MKDKATTVAEAGRLGGLARARAMTAKQRSDAARKAVQARWAKKKKAKV